MGLFTTIGANGLVTGIGIEGAAAKLATTMELTGVREGRFKGIWFVPHTFIIGRFLLADNT